METIRIMEKQEALSWEYDEEADVLYLSIGDPRKAIGIDIGEGVVVRYDEASNEVTGLTIIGLKAKLIPALR